MSRTVKEWHGKSDDTAVPPHVRLRVFLRFAGKCQECGIKIVGKRWICDHRIALINGGENREANLGSIHEACDKTKTAADVAEKSRTYFKAAKNVGISLRKGPPMAGTRASGIRKRMDGTVERDPQRSASRPLERRSDGL